MALCEKGSPALGSVLVLCKLRRADWIAPVCEHLTPDKSAINAYLKSPVASFLLENLIFTMNEESLKLFFDSWMRGRIEELVLHEQG